MRGRREGGGGGKGREEGGGGKGMEEGGGGEGRERREEEGEKGGRKRERG